MMLPFGVAFAPKLDGLARGWSRVELVFGSCTSSLIVGWCPWLRFWDEVDACAKTTPRWFASVTVMLLALQRCSPSAMTGSTLSSPQASVDSLYSNEELRASSCFLKVQKDGFWYGSSKRPTSLPL